MPATLFATRHKVFHFSKNASASFPVLCQNEEGERVIPRSSNQRETLKDTFHKEPTTTPTCSALFLSAVLNLGRSNCSCPCLSGKCSLHLNRFFCSRYKTKQTRNTHSCLTCVLTCSASKCFELVDVQQEQLSQRVGASWVCD